MTRLGGCPHCQERPPLLRSGWCRRCIREGVRARNLAIVAERLAGGCVDCGNGDIRVLEFDHARGSKDFTIGQSYSTATRKKMLAELEKCDVVCANCHRIRTKERG